MKITFFIRITIMCLFYNSSQAQQKIIPLYDGAAPNSEKWNWNEKRFFDHNSTLIYDVSHPSLEAFFPPDSIANGTSIIICPGGGFMVLEIENEGWNMARWLNTKGITAFVLRYRLMKLQTNDPQKEMFARGADPKKLGIQADTVIDMANNDISTAMLQLKNNADMYKINPDKIGIIGFSAGGTLAAGLAYNYSAKTRPAFVAAIYPGIMLIKKKVVQNDAPPIFIAAASDDQLGVNIGSAEFYLDWAKSKHSAELHLYSKGGHGFESYKTQLPVQTWKDRFADWLQVNDFIKRR